MNPESGHQIPLPLVVPPPPADMTERGEWSDAALRVMKERYLAEGETPEDMCWRVAWRIAQAERAWGTDEAECHRIAAQFYTMMVRREFLPNSPTLMNAGRNDDLNFSACFVLPIEDTVKSIYGTMANAAVVHQSGGGTGFSFSRLRPKGNPCKRSGGTASGPVSFLRAYDAATNAIKQGGRRRGANMAVLRVDHPDILEFIDCKLDGGITNFNISVAMTNKFMAALEQNGIYEWVNPHTGNPVKGRRARDVWERIVQAAWRTGDPGLMFIDRFNASSANPVPDLEMIEATNPCGEQGLGPNDVCNLGSINLARFSEPNASEASRRVRWGDLGTAVRLAVRFLDNVIEVNPYPLPEIAETAKGNRRVGLGVMGWADLLMELDIPYESDAALMLADKVMGFISRTAWDESERLAKIRGPFPRFLQSIYRDGPPRRNAAVTTVAPTGSISILANCVAGETLISTLSGKVPIQQLVGKQPYVYGAKGRKVAVAQAAKVWLSKRNALVWRVRFDNDDELVATPDHRVLMGDGTYRALRDLRLFESVVAFRKRTSKTLESEGRWLIGVTGEHERLQQQVVAECLLGRSRRKREVTHHKDHDTLNDTPENLEVMDKSDHARHHSVQNVVKWSRARKGKTFEEIYGVEKAEAIRKKWRQGRKTWNRGRPWTEAERAKIAEATKRAMWRPEVRQNFIDGTRRRDGLAIANHKVVSVGPAGRADVYDMEVPAIGNFVASGVVVHNCSSGVEPAFALAYQHRVMQADGERVLDFFNPIAEQRLLMQGLWSSHLKQRILETGTMPKDGLTWPSGLAVKEAFISRMVQVFKTAHEIAPEWHVKHQAAFQKHSDNSISKTINLPASATPEDVSRAYLLAWELGCLGITVFRDGCKGEQVLHVGRKEAGDTSPGPKADRVWTVEDAIKRNRQSQRAQFGLPSDPEGKSKEAKESISLKTDQELAESLIGLYESAASSKVKPRPKVVAGKTYRVATPLGTAFVTVNENGSGEPFEVFVNVGKAGSDTAAVSEALGRLLSFSLRLPSTMPVKERVEQIVHQLKGIGGRRPAGLGKAKARSLPDAMAQVLAEHIGIAEGTMTATVGAAVEEARATWKGTGDICGECGEACLVYEEGCQKCYGCGYSEC